MSILNKLFWGCLVKHAYVGKTANKQRRTRSCFDYALSKQPPQNMIKHAFFGCLPTPTHDSYDSITIFFVPR